MPVCRLPFDFPVDKEAPRRMHDMVSAVPLRGNRTETQVGLME